MTTSTTEKNVDLEDVLYELSLASEGPSAETIDQFVRRYPQYARELVDFGVELALDALGDEPQAESSRSTSNDVDMAMSRLHNRLYAVRKAGAAQRASAPSNPFSALRDDQLRVFIKEIHANRVFVMKLRDRHIEEATIPPRFRQLSAELLGVPESMLNAHWAAPPVIAAGSYFKSDRKPEATRQQSFAEAVASSSLTEDQQRYLMSL